MWEWDVAFWAQATAVLLAFGLCTVVGVERQLRRKSAGIRTHALVGTGSAIFTLVSAYGFHVLPGIEQGPGDPSRIAAQVVTGIGFLGAGVIFLHKDVVHGLTTAASVWVHKYPGHRAVELRYEDGKGVLRSVLAAATELDLAVTVLRTDRMYTSSGAHVVMVLKMLGRTDVHRAVVEFSELPGVISAAVMPEPEADE